MLLALVCVRVDVLFDIRVGILHDIHDALLVRPLDEVLSKSRILLACSAEKHKSEVVLLAPGPCSCRAVSYADAAADAEVSVAHDLAVDQRQRSDGTDVAVLDALLAAHAAIRVILRLGHSDDSEVVHADFAAVI